MITITKNFFTSVGHSDLDDIIIDSDEISLICDDIKSAEFDSPTSQLSAIRDGRFICGIKPKMITWIDRLTDEKIKSKTIPEGWLE